MIRVEHLSKAFAVDDSPDKVAVDDVSFEASPGTFLTLLGPSGCGKTTTLRSIAGLETPDSGEIEVGRKKVFSSQERRNVAPGKRHVGMVFQSYAIWPHMTVAKNVEYPLKRRRVKGPARERRVREVLEMVGLAELASRPAPDLSGGQQQRVALARALAAEPRVLLLDEPLSNLDARLRRELGDYLRELQRRLELTVVYVTHDQDEAMAMSDTVALMDRGRIVEWGAPQEIYTRPRTEFGARFLGAANFLDGAITGRAGTQAEAQTVYGMVSFVDDGSTSVGDEVLLMVRPEHGVVVGNGTTSPLGSNRFEGFVEKITFRGPYTECEVRVTEDAPPLGVRCQGVSSLQIGESVGIGFPVERCVHVDRGATAVEGGVSVDEADATASAGEGAGGPHEQTNRMEATL